MYQLFYEGEHPPKLPDLPKLRGETDNLWGSSGTDARLFTKLRRLLSRTDEEDRKLILFMAQKMTSRK